MARSTKRSPIRDLLYNYTELDKSMKAVVLCKPCVEQIVLVRRRVKLLAVYVTTGEWPEIEREPSLYVVCDKTGKNFYTVPTDHVTAVGSMEEYPWEELHPVVIQSYNVGVDEHITRRRGNEETINDRLLYYPRSGEVWNREKLVFNWKKKYSPASEMKIREVLNGKTMTVRNKIGEDGYITHKYHDALQAWENQRAFLRGELNG